MSNLPTRLLPISCSDTTPTASVSLLPFHLNFNGPAPISTYFLTRPDPEVSSKDEKGEIAAFRGRGLYGNLITLPNDYSGRILKSLKPNLSKRSVPVPDLLASRKRKAFTPPPLPSRGNRVDITAGGLKKVRRSPRIARMTFSLDDSSPVSVKSDTGEEEEMVLEKSEVMVVEESVMTLPEGNVTLTSVETILETHEERSDTDLTETEIEDNEDLDQEALETETSDITINLRTVGTFNQFKLWNPDRVPVDVNGDIYLRSLNEFINLSTLVGRSNRLSTTHFSRYVLQQLHTC